MKPRTTKLVSGTIAVNAGTVTVLNISGIAGRIIAIKAGGMASALNIPVVVTIDGTQVTNAGMQPNSNTYAEIDSGGLWSTNGASYDANFKNTAVVTLSSNSSYAFNYAVTYETE